MRCWYALIIVIPLMLLNGCTLNGAGGISDHGNERVAGIVIDADSVPVPGVTVTLLPDEYNHITDSTRVVPREAVTDADGRYTFDSLSEGTYALQAEGIGSGRTGIAKSVVVDSINTDAPSIKIDVPGRIYFPVDSMVLPVGTMIFLPGLRYCDIVDSSRVVNMFDIPAGRLTLKAYDPVSKKVLELGRDFVLVEVMPSRTLVLPSRSSTPVCLADEIIVDPVKGYTGDEFTFSPVHQSNKIDENFYYRFSWGDGTISEWSSDVRWKHSWNTPGDYYVQSQVKFMGQYLGWSDQVYIKIVNKP